jgi:hypothetical protein
VCVERQLVFELNPRSDELFPFAVFAWRKGEMIPTVSS